MKDTISSLIENSRAMVSHRYFEIDSGLPFDSFPKLPEADVSLKLMIWWSLHRSLSMETVL